MGESLLLCAHSLLLCCAGPDVNRNVAWLESKFSWVFYVLTVCAFRIAVFLFLPVDAKLGSHITQWVHHVVSCKQRYGLLSLNQHLVTLPLVFCGCHRALSFGCTGH